MKSYGMNCLSIFSLSVALWLVTGSGAYSPTTSLGSQYSSSTKRSYSTAVEVQEHKLFVQKMKRPLSSQPARFSTFHPNHKKSTAATTARTSHPGLSYEQEVAYAFQIRTLRAAVRLRDSLVNKQAGIYIHPTENDWAMACGTTVMNLRRIMHEGQQARTALVDANIGLVTSIAKKYYNARGVLTLQDMVQEGNLGLMEAAERFEPEKKTRFSTYATWWIRQRILRSINDYSRTIRLPAHVQSTLTRIHKAKKTIQVEFGRDATDEEVANHINVPVEKIRLYSSRSQRVFSLEKPLVSGRAFKDDAIRTLGDTLRSEELTPNEVAVADDLRQDIRHLLESLQDLEAQVIRCRFGLEAGEPQSVGETARSLDISRDRVRLLEARSLNKLRRSGNFKLKNYVENEGDVLSTRRTSEASSATSTSTASQPATDRIWFF